MKHLKMLGLFAMAAAALMAFAGSASAQTFTSPAGTEYTGEIKSSLEGSALLKAGFAEITCTTGEVNGKITTNSSTEASGSITKVSFGTAATPCTSPQGTPTVTTLNNNGTLTILKSTHAVSGTGVEVTTAVIGTSCVYGLGATSTSLGTATNSGSGSTAKVTLAISANLPKISGGFLCASPAAWTASYLVTSPSPSVLD